MKDKYKLTSGALIVGLLFLTSCNDKKEYVEKVRQVSDTTDFEQKPEIEISDLPKENRISRGKDGIAIGTLDPEKPGYMINPFTLEAIDISGIPAGTKIRDPNDPNPDHILRVPHGVK